MVGIDVQPFYLRLKLDNLGGEWKGEEARHSHRKNSKLRPNEEFG